MVNWNERSIRVMFYFQSFGFGIGLMVIFWYFTTSLLQISNPIALTISILYGLFYILGMYPNYDGFKKLYTEKLNE